MWYKQSLDLSFLENKEGPSGSYGKYTTNYSPKEKSWIYEETGIEDDNLGIKSFFESTTDVDVISENLALGVFAPEINSKTDLIAPTPPSSMTLRSLRSHKFLITQNLEGLSWHDFQELTMNELLPKGKQVPNRSVILGDISSRVHFDTQIGALNKLEMIGIKWKDFGWNNALFDPNTCKEFIENYKKGIKKSDLSKGLRILDFGWMYSVPGSESYEKLMLLRENLEKLSKTDHTVKKIIYAIDYVCQYNIIK